MHVGVTLSDVNYDAKFTVYQSFCHFDRMDITIVNKIYVTPIPCIQDHTYILN